MTTPTFSQLSFATGTANSTAISFFAGAFDFSTTVHVTLSSNYARVIPAGFPDANAGVAIATSPTAFPQTILSGQRVQFYAPEAAALVAAGAGSYS
jgi:hypothetical protein